MVIVSYSSDSIVSWQQVLKNFPWRFFRKSCLVYFEKVELVCTDPQCQIDTTKPSHSIKKTVCVGVDIRLLEAQQKEFLEVPKFPKALGCGQRWFKLSCTCNCYVWPCNIVRPRQNAENCQNSQKNVEDAISNDQCFKVTLGKSHPHIPLAICIGLCLGKI